MQVMPLLLEHALNFATVRRRSSPMLWPVHQERHLALRLSLLTTCRSKAYQLGILDTPAGRGYNGSKVENGLSASTTVHLRVISLRHRFISLHFSDGDVVEEGSIMRQTLSGCHPSKRFLSIQAATPLVLNDLEYFETRGLNVLVFSNWYDGLFQRRQDERDRTYTPRSADSYQRRCQA